eukprot:12497019-Alexandrium_andersonii.AAC.1
MAVRRLEDETPEDTLARAIATVLLSAASGQPMTREESERLRCKPEVIKRHWQGKDDVVLVVDELNVLLQPGGGAGFEGSGLFLREAFLDPVGRHLVFSTRVPAGAGIEEVLGRGTGSLRDAVAVEMPTARDIGELRGMHEACRALTPCEAAYYSRIPSLIYTVKTQPTYSFRACFKDIPKPARSVELLATFLSESFGSAREDAHGSTGAFDSLTEFSEGQ